MGFAPGTVVVAQVVGKTNKEIAKVWLLDYEVLYKVHGAAAATCEVGDIVYCRFATEKKIDKIRKAWQKTREAYASKAIDLSPEALAGT